MALTLEAQQRLERVELTKLFEKSNAQWMSLARQSYEFVNRTFPDGATIRADDVAKVLVPLLEVNKQLIDTLNSKKLKQKYWVRNFCDLILDRSWSKIQPKK